MSKIIHNENEEFAKRLFLSLENVGYEVKNITHLTTEINKLFSEKSITSHAVRKWLNGQTIPAHSRLLRLADWLGVSPSWLRFGEGGMYKSDIKQFQQSNDNQFSMLLAKIKALTSEELNLVINQIDLIIKIRNMKRN